MMAVHHGGKVGKSGKILASKGSSKSAKVPSRDMRKFICRLWLNEVNRQ